VQVHSRAYRCLAAQRQVDLTTGKPLFWVCFNAMSCENAAKPGFFATAGTERRVFSRLWANPGRSWPIGPFARTSEGVERSRDEI
jgi:hypothetical protein